MLTDAPDSAKLFWSEDLTDCQPDPENQVMPKPTSKHSAKYTAIKTP